MKSLDKSYPKSANKVNLFNLEATEKIIEKTYTRRVPGLCGIFCDIGGYNFYFLWIDIKTYKNMSE